jgi:hypothetical protein
MMEEVSPGFFDTVGIVRVAGRDFSWSDTPAAPAVAIVNASLARPVSERRGRRIWSRLGRRRRTRFPAALNSGSVLPSRDLRARGDRRGDLPYRFGAASLTSVAYS